MSMPNFQVSAAALNVGALKLAPAKIEGSLASGILKMTLSELGLYDGKAAAGLAVDASLASPIYAMRADLRGVRALPLLTSAADFTSLDGKMQAQLDIRTTGRSPTRDDRQSVRDDECRFPGWPDPRPQRRADDPQPDVEHALGLAGRSGADHRPHRTARELPYREGQGGNQRLAAGRPPRSHYWRRRGGPQHKDAVLSHRAEAGHDDAGTGQRRCGSDWGSASPS